VERGWSGANQNTLCSTVYGVCVDDFSSVLFKKYIFLWETLSTKDYWNIGQFLIGQKLEKESNLQRMAKNMTNPSSPYPHFFSDKID
jgi:hypothetical protein